MLNTHPHVLLLFQNKNKQTTCYRCVLKTFRLDLPVPCRRLWNEPSCHTKMTSRQYSEQEGKYFSRAGVLCIFNLLARKTKNWENVLIVSSFMSNKEEKGRLESAGSVPWHTPCFSTISLFFSPFVWFLRLVCSLTHLSHNRDSRFHRSKARAGFMAPRDWRSP